jgi:very-short-patch-repair endonuclease/predicted transcriptional regulator of viral defense system
VGVIDQVIEALAAIQHGVFAVWQLERRGIDRHTLIARVRDGRLRRLHRGVYATGAHVSVRGQLMAAALAYGPKAALSHRPAGFLHDVITRNGGLVDVTLPHGTRNRRGLRSHEAILLPQDHTFIDSIPVTSLPRTLLDLAATLTARELQRAYEAAEARGILDISAMTELLARTNGHRGTPALTAVLALDPTAAADARSELERLFLDLLRAHNIPMPAGNVLVDGYLVDAYWPAGDLIVELDGYEFHNDRETFESDRRKWTSLRRAGHELLVFTYRHVVDDPGWVVASVADTLAPVAVP